MFNRQAGRGNTRSLFEQQLNREVLASERLRIGVLFILFGLIAAVMIIVILVPPLYAAVNAVFRGKLPGPTLLLFLIPLLAFEGIVWTIIGNFIRRDIAPHPIIRYGNALIEASLPTLMILFAGTIFGPAYALTSPPALFYFLFIALSALRMDVGLAIFSGAVSAAEYGLLALIWLGGGAPQGVDPILVAPLYHFGKVISYLLAGLITGLVTFQIKRRLVATLREVDERNRIIGLFGQHVSPSVVERLLDEKTALVTEIRDVTVLFLDIRDFTTYAERTSPQEVVSYLNALFEFMVESVNRHHGIINKFLGDGFMAIFGAPLSSGEDTRNAVAAAQEIIHSVEAAVREGKIPPTRVGIGLHAGHAVTGNVGARDRQEYTIIGDVVNVASRVEQLNKQFGSALLVSGAVWERVQQEHGDAASLGPVQVKGHEMPVEVYKLA